MDLHCLQRQCISGFSRTSVSFGFWQTDSQLASYVHTVFDLITAHALYKRAVKQFHSLQITACVLLSASF